MPELTLRDRVLRAIEAMPSDATFGDVMDRLYLLEKIERGRRQIAAGEGVTHDEAKRSMKRWNG